jgi:hypothetical protein
MLSRARRSATTDGGWAMLTVVVGVLVMTILAMGAVAVVDSRQGASRRDQDFQAANQAALAGVDNYVARLQADPNYFVEGNSDPDNLAMHGFAPLSGADSEGSYTYSVDKTQAYTTGVLTLTATGRVNGVNRTVTAQLKKSDFLDYMYFTKYETIDPQATGSSANCAYHWYGDIINGHRQYGDRQDTSDCPLINFIDADTLRGPVHSQDEMVFDASPTFENEFSTEWPDAEHPPDPSNSKYYYYCNASNCRPSFSRDYPPSYKIIPFPNTNSTLQTYADPAQGGQGCLFQGPTNIVLNWGGRMTVTSPETPPSFNTNCAAVGTDWSTGVNIPVPTDQVVYVESPTASYSCTVPPGFPYPASGDDNTTQDKLGVRPSCSHGDVYVHGWLQGKLTIGAANNVYITGNVRYQGTNTDSNIAHNVPNDSDDLPYSKDTGANDVLGLSANNFIEIMHPLEQHCTSGRHGSSCSWSESDNPMTDFQIDAALVASNDSILVQDWDLGDRLGVLTINGGMIQAFRGPVGTGSGSSNGTGYSKDYNYDERLLSLSPPHLASLASSAWNSVAFGEGAPQ